MDKNRIYTQDALETLQMFLAPHPVITHHFHKQQIARSVEHYLLKDQSSEVTKDILIKALEDRYPQNEPSTLRLRSPDKMMDLIKQQQNINDQDPIVKISRWSSLNNVIAPAGKDVFAFYGGSRKGGNTDGIVDAALSGAKKQGAAIEKICFEDKTLSPCTGCLVCQSKQLETHCVIQDDMPYIYKRFLECDAFVLGFPVYTGRESAQTAVFFDRLKALTDPWRKTKFKPRRGLLVATWGWPSQQVYQGLVCQMATILFMFGVETIEIVTGSGFWDAYYQKGSVRLDPKGLTEAENAGRQLMQDIS